MRLKIETHGSDCGQDYHTEEFEPTTGKTTHEAVATFCEMTEEELTERINTGKWFGGKFVQQADGRIKFISDVSHCYFSLVE